jgi:hypothetical protein
MCLRTAASPASTAALAPNEARTAPPEAVGVKPIFVGGQKEGANILEIEITNTASNELAGNPARLKELEQKGWLRNSYIGRYLAFDREMVPSGLLGPVRLSVYERDR